MRVLRLNQPPEWMRWRFCYQHLILFCNIHGGFVHLAHLYTEFQRLLEEAGLPRMRFHDLRHSAATILMAMGIHAKVVQELLGHSTIAMTLNIYSHVLPSLQKEAMEKWGDVFGQQDDQRDHEGDGSGGDGLEN